MSRRVKPWSRNSAIKRPVARDLKQFAAKWEDKLGLNKRWFIEYQVRHLESGCAEVRWIDGYHNATIAFDEKYMDSKVVSAADREHTVIHELMHLVFAEMDDKLSDFFGLDGGCYGTYARERESICDTLANILLRKNAKPRTASGASGTAAATKRVAR